MRHCAKCLMPETRPDLDFDFEGICDACRSVEKKNEAIDWKQRKIEFENLLNILSSKDESKYDCVIPVSGGKDSHLTLFYAKIIYGLNKIEKEISNTAG